jgi:UDP-N-acetylmuramoylalanine--D-glutamate ligase
MERQLRNGAWLDNDGYIHMAYRGMDVPIMHRDEIAILGDHNVANYLTAITAVWGYVGVDSIKKVAREFGGVEHRIEFVREVNGVKYYNDSIASSPTRTIAGLKAFGGKVHLIAGGYDKHIPFEPMVPYVIDKAQKLYLCGDTADKIEKAVRDAENYNGNPEIIRVKDIAEAVEKAYQNTKSGDVVTLSPACASFDAFPNFAARGNYFKELVNKL